MWTPTSLTCMRCRAQNSGSKLAHPLGSYRNLASMPLMPRSLVCVQRSCRPLLERPETAAKFVWTE
ncbi:hypothetical protein Taro_014314 [Colocasia esculenta]|uniref:Uncharacterized protein n=1 Tax=Colocasia esculenta TaxID=4460 RepID=A0A843U8R0_COLES|nr:hypothetical protein [Colocasia esculenta]